MIQLFPAKCCNEILRCSGSVWAGIVTNHHNTLAKHTTLLILDRATQQKPAWNVEHWEKKSTSRKPFLSQNNLHMIFRDEVVCLNFAFVGDEVSLHSMDCCFDRGVACSTHVSSPVTTQLEKLLSSSLYCVGKSNALACRFKLCTSVSIFGTQCEHNFRNLSLSDTIKWRSDCEIWGKCRVSDVMVNHLFFLIFSSTAPNKS